jgi:DNA-binding transcriptional MerR regulator
MQHFNPIQVARALNISDKTVRRHIQKGTITATRKASGELKIAEDQIEKLRLVLELEDRPRHVQQMASIGRHEQADMSGQVETDIEQRLASMAQSIANLNATVANQTRRIGELAARVAQLEAQASLVASVQPETVLPTSAIIPTYKPQNRNVARSEVPADLPSGTLSASEFAAILDIDKEHMKNYMRRGVDGEWLDITEIPHHTRVGYTMKYLTPSQQTKAIEILKRHGKIE